MRQREPGDENCCESDSVNDERDDADHEVGHERKEGGRTEEQERDRNEPGADGRDCARVEVLESIGKNIYYFVCTDFLPTVQVCKWCYQTFNEEKVRSGATNLFFFVEYEILHYEIVLCSQSLSS